MWGRREALAPVTVLWPLLNFTTGSTSSYRRSGPEWAFPADEGKPPLKSAC
jgi:hypothetical protein